MMVSRDDVDVAKGLAAEAAPGDTRARPQSPPPRAAEIIPALIGEGSGWGAVCETCAGRFCGEAKRRRL